MTDSKSSQEAGALKLPLGACAYEEYDPSTLTPLNDQTRIRLAELGWRREDFEGKSVLDIGSNSGILSLEALRLGAERIVACDVQDQFVDFFQKVVTAKKLPVTVQKRGFRDLKGPDDTADVVLFMEVLHWAVAQGNSIEACVDRLVSLTRETLFIEFPWSVDEPSIRAQTKLTAETYNADSLIDLLTRHFVDVKVTRFMRYFGFASASKRVLLKCMQKRLESPILVAMPNLWPLDLKLPNGRYENRVVYGKEGSFFIKEMSHYSHLLRLPEESLNALFDGLHAAKARHIALPTRLKTGYVLRSEDGRAFMSLPLIGGLALDRVVSQLTIDRLLPFLVALRAELRTVSPEVVQGFIDIRASGHGAAKIDDPAFWDLPLFEGEVGARAKELNALRAAEPASFVDSFVHGDIQSGNFLRAGKDELILIDLDNLSAGTAYSDALTALMYFGAEPDDFERLVELLRPTETRDVNRYDIAHAAGIGLGWLRSVTQKNMVASDSNVIKAFERGFLGLMKLDEKIADAPAVPQA